MSTQQIDIFRVIVDRSVQPRERVDASTVEEYAAAMRSGAQFPALVVFDDGRGFWLADGFHRIEAARIVGLSFVACDVRTGGRRDAVLFAVGANSTHGLRRTVQDRRRAVMLLLDDAEWCQWSDRTIARRCNVSHTFVGSLRPAVVPARKNTTRHGSVYVMNTAGIREANLARGAAHSVAAAEVAESAEGMHRADSGVPVPCPHCNGTGWVMQAAAAAS